MLGSILKLPIEDRPAEFEGGSRTRWIVTGASSQIQRCVSDHLREPIQADVYPVYLADMKDFAGMNEAYIAVSFEPKKGFVMLT